VSWCVESEVKRCSGSRSAAVCIPDLWLLHTEPVNEAPRLVLLLCSSRCRQTVCSVGDSRMLAELSLHDKINLAETRVCRASSVRKVEVLLGEFEQYFKEPLEKK